MTAANIDNNRNNKNSDRPTHTLDLRGEVCPFTFVKTKLKLEEIDSGEVLEVIFDHQPAVEDVPRSVKTEGHEVLSIEEIGDNLWRVVIKKR